MSKTKIYDVFLSHNRNDKPAVEFLALKLKNETSLRPWLDVWNLIPGEPLHESIEEALDTSITCAVFVGPTGISTWQNEEMQSALQRKIGKSILRIIPVLLPGASLPERGELPSFLSRLTWVDFRTTEGLFDEKAFNYFVTGIKGKSTITHNSNPSKPQLSVIEAPYRGLESFNADDAHYFFGRESNTQHLLEKLKSTRFLTLLGPSGSGKSSLAQAGLINKLKLGALPFSSNWSYLYVKPGATPLQELAVSLFQLGEVQKGVTIQQLLNDLESDERSLHTFVKLLLNNHKENRFFIFIDQFEELFTLCKNKDERIQFINCLRYAVNISGGQTVVVITMRADFLTPATEYVNLSELISENQFIVSPMDELDLRKAIEEPAKSVKLTFENGLVERILKDAGQEPGTLPLLEDTMLQLWENRNQSNNVTFQIYNKVGGVQGALAKKADSIWEKLDSERKALMRRILLRLTQPGQGTGDTRRRAKIYELLNYNEDPTIADEIIENLANTRLLTISMDANGNKQVEIAHEALIRGWPRLRNWLDENREILLLHHKLSEVAQEWDVHNKDQSFLFSGTRLFELIEKRKIIESELNPLEREFLDVSFRKHEKEIKSIKIRRLITTAVFLIIFIFLFYSSYLYVKRNESQIIAARQKALVDGVKLGTQSLTSENRLIDKIGIGKETTLNTNIQDIIVIDEQERVYDSLNVKYLPTTDDNGETVYILVKDIANELPPIFIIDKEESNILNTISTQEYDPLFYSSSPQSVAISLETDRGPWAIIVVVK